MLENANKPAPVTPCLTCSCIGAQAPILRGYLRCAISPPINTIIMINTIIKNNTIIINNTIIVINTIIINYTIIKIDTIIINNTNINI
jgi:hypothetical protein